MSDTTTQATEAPAAGTATQTPAVETPQAPDTGMLSLTVAAASEIKKIITEQGLPEQTRLRVGVKGAGCSGFSYVLDLTEEPPTENDDEIESNGVKMVIDQKSLLYLSGVEIDFKDELIGRGFTFRNPNATSTCGCGSSFSA
jgi:iron-sulfur cluster assembly protein